MEVICPTRLVRDGSPSWRLREAVRPLAWLPLFDERISFQMDGKATELISASSTC